MSQVQSVVFSVSKFSTKEARKWLRAHHFKPSKRVRKTKNKLWYRIRPPTSFQRLRTKKITPSINLIIGFK